MSDTRIVYGLCTWWDSIDKAGSVSEGLPCCPHCRSPLYEVPNEATWWAGIGLHGPEHVAKVESWRGRCSRTEGFDPGEAAPPLPKEERR